MTKIRVLTAVLIIVLSLASGVLLRVVLGTCVVDESRSFFSPGNDYEANLLVSSCGATVSNYTDVEIDDRRVFSVKYTHINDIGVEWVDDNKIVITYSGNREDFFMYKEFYKDVHIVLQYVDNE